jgi:uncharacterized protein
LKSSDAQFAFVRRGAAGIELRIKVVPGASRSEIVGVLGDRLKIRIAAPPEKGKANETLLNLIAEWLGTKNIELIAGHGSAEKTVRVDGMFELGAAHLGRIKRDDMV